MENLCQDGNAIVMVSSEIPEVLGISDRVIVMNRGKIVNKYKRDDFDKHKIIKDASG